MRWRVALVAMACAAAWSAGAGPDPDALAFPPKPERKDFPTRRVSSFLAHLKGNTVAVAMSGSTS